jgi:hypothetical protein
MRPKFVQKTFSYIKADIVSEKTEELVNKLVKEGYSVRVIVHDPVHHHRQSDGYSSVEFMTTVIATLSDKVDIGLSLPE